MRWLSIFLIFALLSAPLVFAAKDDKRTDDVIYDEVRRRLANDPDVQGAGFEVQVQNGAVTIKGVVEKEKHKAKAEKLAKKVKGVTSVNNLIQIGPRGIPPVK
jgi:osmotically-inducible protein OsmY